MDAAFVFRQGLGTVAPRQNQTSTYAHHHHPHRKPQPASDDLSDGETSGNRVAHTLTACCRCRQRKTRCDPTLPRCLPCERSGSTCEYYDAARGRKINRYYVIKLQDKVRALEAELDQYTDDEGDYPRTTEDMVRPGGMIRLNASDETPRYLGPSSGIAMTRLLMEEAKRYTDSKRISDLIPEVRARRQARMQSIQMTGTASHGKRSYPMVSEGPAESLPTRPVADKLLEIFHQKAQLFWPVLHEKVFARDMEAVYNGDTDTYRNFVLRMVIAISLQKLDTQYAGLADSYYLAAMQYVEDLIRPKDLKTLQCLVLIAQYSLLTQTRVPVYYVIGLATRICHQEGLTEEQTISTGYNLNAQTIDMRRRLVWVVAAMEYGLAHAMGRPCGFAKKDDHIDVDFFSIMDDENITENGIQPGPPCERKQVSIHFFKMRVLQAEIRGALYEKKRPEPKNDSHPWFEGMENKIKDWVDSSPANPPWCRPWFNGRSHQMKVFMYRPSPQVPKPSSQAATICYESSEFMIQLAKKQMDSGAVDITWVFLLTLNMCLNTLLWSTSYAEVRRKHPKEEVEEMVNIALDVLDRSAERWPGTSSASQLYAVLAKACLQSYDTQGPTDKQFGASLASTPSVVEPQSSPVGYVPASNQQQQVPYIQPPQFGQVFDSPPESMSAYTFDPNFPQNQPTFRSNSIFCHPSTTDSNSRRFSYFPPDFMQPPDNVPDELNLAIPLPPSNGISTALQTSGQLPSPPESLVTGNQSSNPDSTTLSPPEGGPVMPAMSNATPANLAIPPQAQVPPQGKLIPPQQPGMQPTGTYQNGQPLQTSVPQRALPAAAPNSTWFAPPAFIQPYNYNGNAGGDFFGNNMQGPNGFSDMSGTGLGLQSLGIGPEFSSQFAYPPARQGSLTQSQQLELMNVLETEGVGDIEAFLNAGNNVTAASW